MDCHWHLGLDHCIYTAHFLRSSVYHPRLPNPFYYLYLQLPMQFQTIVDYKRRVEAYLLLLLGSKEKTKEEEEEELRCLHGKFDLIIILFS